jgi:hypothetical protein
LLLERTLDFMAHEETGMTSHQPDGTPQDEDERPSKRAREWFEVVTVAILALAALATAWSGYQASLWDGIQASNYSQAAGARTNGAQQRTAANQFRLADLSVFENYVDARIDGDDELAGFYLQRFRDEFRVAYDAWIALDPFNNPEAPASPLGMPEYQLAADAEADRLEARADELFAAGEAANTDSDVYTLTTLLFAASLFFAAISERFEFVIAKVVLLSVAVVALLAGIGIALGQPITSG